MDVSPDPATILVDPLSPVCRRARRNLLAAGVGGILVGRAGLVPTQLAGFGISLGVPEQNWLVSLLVLTIVYFVVAFALYGLADFMIFRKAYHGYKESIEIAGDDWTEDDQWRHDELRSRVGDIGWVYRWSKPAAIGRALFEFALPVLVGGYGIYSLAMHSIR